MSFNKIVGTFLFAGVSAFGAQTIDLKAGATVTLDQLSGPTTVTCQPATVSPKCACVLIPMSGRYEIRLLGHDILLDTVGARVDCAAKVASYFECR